MNKLLIFIFLFSNTLVQSQHYSSKVIPQDYPPSLTNISLEDGDVVISGRIAILQNDGMFNLGSKSVWFDNNLLVVKERLVSNYAFARESPVHFNDRYYAFCDKWQESDLSFIEMDEIGNIINTSDIFGTGQNIGAITTTYFEGHLYTAHYLDPDENQRDAYISKIALNGDIIWTKKIQGSQLTVIYEITPSLDGHLLLSTEYFEPSKTYNQLIKMDFDGHEIWRYQDEANDVTGSVAPFIATLSDGNILIKSLEDHGLDPIYSQNDWSPYPEHLIWISPDGEFIRDTLMPANHPADHNLFDVTAGNGDYFFGFGRWEDYETDVRYGWLFKMSNDGEMIWDKHYRHYPSNDDLEISTIEELIELDNGDIIFAGIIENFTQGNTDLWIARINEHGCFGGDDCDDNMITDIPEVEIEDVVNVYPNPASSVLHIDINNSMRNRSAEIYSLGGNLLIRQSIEQTSNAIDIDGLNAGFYIIKIKEGERDIAVRKLAKM